MVLRVSQLLVTRRVTLRRPAFCAWGLVVGADAIFLTGVNCLSARTTQPFIEQPAKQIAVPETAVTILGKRRVIGY